MIRFFVGLAMAVVPVCLAVAWVMYSQWEVAKQGVLIMVYVAGVLGWFGLAIYLMHRSGK